MKKGLVLALLVVALGWLTPKLVVGVYKMGFQVGFAASSGESLKTTEL